MCSTPRARSQIGSANKYQSTSILAKLTIEQRQHFVQKANEAADRRYQIRQAQLQTRPSVKGIQTKKIPVSYSTSLLQSHKWHYWLVKANLSDLFALLFRMNRSV